MLTKKDLGKLADLSKMKIEEKEEEKLLRDLGGVLAHFEELKELSTDDVEPMNGGTSSLNVWRNDEVTGALDGEAAKKEFPETKDGYLKIPAIFDANAD